MLRNYFIIAFRNIIKYKGYSVINILGLALGMAIFFLTLSLAYYELSYDRLAPRPTFPIPSSKPS